MCIQILTGIYRKAYKDSTFPRHLLQGESEEHYTRSCIHEPVLGNVTTWDLIHFLRVVSSGRGFLFGSFHFIFPSPVIFVQIKGVSHGCVMSNHRT
jgi:hypothetical protein